MAWWGRPKCPVRPEEQAWIEESLDWLVSSFGSDVLMRPVVLPGASFFPPGYAGSEADVRAVFATVAGLVGVPVERVVLELEPDDAMDELIDGLPVEMRSRGAAAHWRRRDGVSVITVEMAKARQPVALVATIAHELGHERLLGEERRDPDRRDDEPMTDLFTVFFGFGVFSANAAFEYSRSTTGWRTSRLGYLTEAMFGYALARYAWLRGETEPDWAGLLDTNPRTYLKQGLRYLNAD
ncbi:hypothetical protein [Kribbella lupini]